MNRTNGWRATVVAGLVAGTFAPAARAALPMLDEKMWLGHFIGISERNHRIGFTAKGEGIIMVLNAKDQPLSSKLNLKFAFGVREIQDAGKIVWHPSRADTLESAQAATTKPENVVIRGKTTGDAAFEATLNTSRGALELGGHLVDKGKLTKHPAAFAVRIQFPDVYANRKSTEDKRKIKEFEKATARDAVQLTLADSKRVKLDPSKDESEKLAAATATGIAGVRAEFSAYAGARFEIAAPAGSTLILTPKDSAALRKGFTLDWVPAAAGKSPLAIEVR